MAFVKATRKKAKLRLALTGPSGSGKTYGALKIAKGLGGKIACIDTEKGSASLYEDIVPFDVLELSAPFTPESYISAIKEAEKEGYDILIIDSTTHEWSGPGGCLELLEDLAKAKYRGNTWSAWNEITPRHRSFIDAMLHSNMHIIATGRSKTETSQSEVNGKKTVVKLGMKTEQRDGFEYEFTVVLDISHTGNYAVSSKDRTGLFSGDPVKITEETGKKLLAWLETGVEAPQDDKELLFRSELMTTINVAPTLYDLKTAYVFAVKSTTDKSLIAELTDAKDKRKAELAKYLKTEEKSVAQMISEAAEDD